jgi:hypothetical protein
MNTFSKLVLAALPVAALTSPAAAQFGGPKVATVSASARPTAVARGGRGVLLITVSVGPQYHLNAHAPNDAAYIPTVFVGQATPGLTFGAAHYPAPRAMKLSYAPKPLLVYVGRVVIAVPFTVAKTARPGRLPLAGTLSFQGCDAKSCYPPASAPVRAAVTVR